MKLPLFELREFAVLSFSADVLRGAWFAKRANEWTLERLTETAVDAEDASASFRSAIDELGGGKAVIILSGSLPGGVFFRFDSVAMPVNEQRGAVEMEMSRHLLQVPAKPTVQFFSQNVPAGSSANVNAFVCGKPGLTYIVSMLKRAGRRADACIHPLLSVMPGDPDAFAPEADSEYYLSSCGWKRFDGNEKAIEEADRKWLEIFSRDIKIAPGVALDLRKHLGIMLTARLIISGEFIRQKRSIFVLPAELRPIRYRRHLKYTAVFGAVLLVSLIWQGLRGKIFAYTERRQVQSALTDARRKSNNIEQEIKRFAKKQKEMAKILSQYNGEADVLRTIAEITCLLPKNVMLADFRWSDSGLDLTLMSEDINTNIADIFIPMTKWKIASLQQRGNDSVTTNQIKLVPADDESLAPAANQKKRKQKRSGR